MHPSAAGAGAFCTGQVSQEVEPGVWLTLNPLPGEGYELKKVQFDRQVRGRGGGGGGVNSLGTDWH